MPFVKEFKDVMHEIVKVNKEISQQELADAVGLSSPAVKKWFEGGKVDLQNLIKICEATNHSPNEILGYVDDKIVINPTEAQRAKSRLTLTVAGTSEKIAMIEAGADEIPDATMLEAIKTAHIDIKRICEFILNIKNEIGKEKFVIYEDGDVEYKYIKDKGDEFNVR